MPPSHQSHGPHRRVGVPKRLTIKKNLTVGKHKLVAKYKGSSTALRSRKVFYIKIVE